jgi:hypothetical protein
LTVRVLALTLALPSLRFSTGMRAPTPSTHGVRDFLEVWLLDAKTGGMVALGVLDGDRGSYAVPPARGQVP